ncbi:MAG: nitrite/sulfite reductase, partial [Planctomycetota bacterium]
MSTPTWKQLLLDAMPQKMSHEIDIFESQMELRRQGKIEDKVFAETRLRRGAYGQRYDTGQRHDGTESRPLNYPNQGITKGPDTEWDAPGMVRIKIPYGKVSPEQLDLLAQLAEEYSDGILHVTTRQDIQLHYVHIDDTPDLMRRLAAVGITTREACGNSVRNVTGCPLTSVCHTEAFDVTPYADALVWFMMGHPDVQDFGRKFKIAFSGCGDKPCGLTNMHDMGLIAVNKEVDGVEKRGFKMFVGGGLGAVPHDAQLVSDFVIEEELLPMSQAVARVFSRLGEKKNRNRARVKFLVAKLGIEEFRRLVFEERPKLAHDDRWTAYLKDLPSYKDQPIKDAVQLNLADRELPAGYEAWATTNVYKQRQPGYVAVTLSLPLGDFTAQQSRDLADIARKYVGD